VLSVSFGTTHVKVLKRLLPDEIERVMVISIVDAIYKYITASAMFLHQSLSPCPNSMCEPLAMVASTVWATACFLVNL
jgi:hypothetical protein